MRPRVDRRSGPLTRDELLAAFDRGYGTNSRGWLATAWDMPAESGIEVLADHIADTEAMQARYVDLSPEMQVIMRLVAENGGRIRGENLRRDILLSGLGDMRDTLSDLVKRALLVPVPAAGELDLDIDAQLEQGTFLQRDVTLPSGALPLFEDGDEGEGVVAAIIDPDKVTVEFSGSADLLELNLLHLGRLLLDNSLRLNKSGAPNRRSLARFARGIVFPGESNEAGEENLDLGDPTQLDYISFLLGLALELGFIQRCGEQLEGSPKVLDGYFTAAVTKRNRDLFEAFKNLRYWNELDSIRGHETSSGNEFDEHLSLGEATGQPLIGIRGFILSVLRRARFRDWTRQSAIRELCLEMDASYLRDSLTKSAPDASSREYVDAFVKRALKWLGVLDTGRFGNAHMVRFTPRGLAMLGLADTDTAHRPDQCMIVQPNLEVMVFLDAAPVETIYQIYRLAERRKLADRVATFALTAESVQRGYSLGLDADQAIELLSGSSAVPLDDSTRFQLTDWQRMHRRMRIYQGGILIRHPDPDQFDLDLGQLKHEAADDVDFVRVGPTAAYMSHDDPALKRFMDRHKGIRIDYLGEVPPCLHFVDPLTVMVAPVRADVVTLWELEHIAVELEDDAIPGSKFYELDIGMIEARWPENTLEEATHFLDRHCEGGLPPSQYLVLRSGLIGPASAEIREDVVVLVLENHEDGDIFARVEETEGHVVERLGPRVFQIARSDLAELREVLDELGIRV